MAFVPGIPTPFGSLGGLGGVAPMPVGQAAPGASSSALGALGALAGAPQAPAQQPSFLGSPQFGNALQALGVSLMSSPSGAPLSGFAPALQSAQQQTAREQQAAIEAEERAKAETKENQTVEWLTQKYPDLAPLYASNPGEVISEAIRRQSPAGADPTANMQNVEYLVSQGVDRDAAIAQVFGEQGPSTVVNVGGTDEFYTQLDKNLATQTTDLISAGTTANSNNIRLGQLEQNLANAPQGMQGVVTQFAGNLGIPIEGLDDLQASQAIINQMVPGQRPPGSGTMSDADLALFKASLPAIINQPGGNAKIIATTKAINDYTIKQAEIATAVANREITPADGRKLQSQIPNPLAGFSSGGAQQPQAEPSAINPATGERIVLRNGQWVPAQ